MTIFSRGPTTKINIPFDSPGQGEYFRSREKSSSDAPLRSYSRLKIPGMAKNGQKQQKCFSGAYVPKRAQKSSKTTPGRYFYILDRMA